MTDWDVDVRAVFAGIDLSDGVHTHVGVGASLGAMPTEYEPVYDASTGTWRQGDVRQGWATTAIPVVAEFDTIGELTAWILALKAACRAGGRLTWQWTADDVVRSYAIGASDEPEVVEDNRYILQHRAELTLALVRWPRPGPPPDPENPDPDDPEIIVDPDPEDPDPDDPWIDYPDPDDPEPPEPDDPWDVATPEGAEAAVFTTSAWGGYGVCSYDMHPPATPPSYGDSVEIGGSLYRGKVVNVPEMIATEATEEAVTGTYHVVCEGEAKEYGRDEAFAMAFRDRDLAEWQVADCGEAWSAIGDGFKIETSLEGSIRLSAAAPEELLSYTTPATLANISLWYEDYLSNQPPASAAADFPPPLPVWSAAWYLIQDGLTDDRISMLRCHASWSTLTPLQDALTVADLDNPTGPPDDDPEIGYRFSAYPDMNMWTDFYGMKESPGCFFGGIYACENPNELPVSDPLAMYSDSRCLHRFSTRTSGSVDLELATDSRLLCVYSGYRPIRQPVWTGEIYDLYGLQHGHLIREMWFALARYYAEAGCFVELADVEIIANGFPAGCNDLAEVFAIIFPEGCTCEASEVQPESTIMVRPFTTRLASIEPLLALTDQPRVWGWYESGLEIAEDFGHVEFDPSLPGVSVDAQLAIDGAVETCTVLFQCHTRAIGAAAARLVPDMPQLQTVESVDGIGTNAAAGERNAFRDSTATAHSLAAAQAEGADEIARRGYQQWEGTITLEGVPGAQEVRGGQRVTCGAAVGALVTGTSVDLGSQTATLTLGSHGYKSKFAKALGALLGVGTSGQGDQMAYKRQLDTRRRT